MMNRPQKIAIAGSGLVGALQSIYFAKRGFEVDLYERRPDMRSNRIAAGRSINLALSDRGFRGLQGVGIDDQIREMAIPMYRRVMHDKQGNLTFQSYGKDGQAIYSVSRGGLNCRLMDLAEASGVKIHFNHRCSDVDLEGGSAVFNDSEKEHRVTPDFLVGADGAFSEVRNEMAKRPWYNYSQYYIEYAYKELSIPPHADGSHRLEKNALHIWPRKDFMLIALPNLDGTFTLTLFFPKSGPLSFDSLDTIEKAEAFFAETFPDALALMPDFRKEYAENPASAMVIVRCYPWTWGEKVMLIGDAAHAIVPFYGQGMNCGFEDCTVFFDLLDRHTGSWEGLLRNYEQSRKPNGDAIAELALRNFIEMRDKVGDPEFLLQKKIEQRFSDKHPDKWIPLYSMVTFSHIPYHEALQLGDKQEAIMKGIMNMPDIEQKWDSEEVEQQILHQLSAPLG
jgi:kynurenine 3-monooxygenase